MENNQDQELVSAPQIVVEVPKTEDITRDANLRVAEQERLARAQNTMEASIANKTWEANIKAETVVAKEQKIESMDPELLELSLKVDSLKEQSEKLDMDIRLGNSKNKMFELHEELVVDEADSAMEKVDDDLQKKQAEVDSDTSRRVLALWEKSVEELAELTKMRDEQLADMEAGIKLTGGAELGPNGEMVFKDAEAITRSLAGQPAALESVMQQAVGGEMAVELTDKVIAEKKAKLDSDIAAIEKAANDQKMELQKQAEAKKATIAENLKAKREEIHTQKAKVDQEIEGFISQKAEVDAEFAKQGNELDAMVDKRREEAADIDKLGADVENLRTEVDKNTELLKRVVEKIGKVEKEGVTAVNALTEMGKAVEIGRKAFEAQVRKVGLEIERDIMRKRAETNQKYEDTIEKVDTTYAETITGIENSLIEMPDSGYQKDQNGELVSTRKGLEALMQKLPDTIVEDALAAKKARDEKKAAALEKQKEEVDEQIAERIARVGKLDKEKSEIEAQYAQAAESVGALRLMAEEVFGPATEKPKILKFMLGAGNLIKSIFRGRK